MATALPLPTKEVGKAVDQAVQPPRGRPNMSNSVCEQAPARQAKSHSAGFQVGAFSLVSAAVIRGLTGQGTAGVTVVILLVVVVVVVPAIWSSKGYRRRAGLDVLDRLLPWRR
jgi:hypothetical protein